MQNQKIKYYIISSSLILILSLLLGFFRNSFLDEKFPNIYNDKSSKLQKNVSPESKINQSISADSLVDSLSLSNFLVENYWEGQSEYIIINIDTAKSIYSYQLATIIDARDPEDYLTSHIPGAINIPYDKDKKYSQILIDSLVGKDKSIMIYCNDSTCDLGENLAKDLNQMGLFGILYFKDGYKIWNQNSLPIKIPDKLLVEEYRENRTFILSNNVDGDDVLLAFSIMLVLILYFSDTYKRFIPLVSMLVLAYIFISFGIGKILDPIKFAKDISQYNILPDNLLKIGSLTLPWLEVILGTILLVSAIKYYFTFTTIIKSKFTLTDTSSIFLVILLVMFIIMITIAFLNGNYIDCGCSGESKGLYSKQFNMIKRLLLDLFLLFLALIVKYRYKFLNKYV